MVVHPLTVAESCLQRNAWICPEYVTTRQDILLQALGQHLYITVAAVALGLLVALPLAVVAVRSSVLEGLVVGAATVSYAVPSLATFALLVAFGPGLNENTVILGLAVYSLAILLRNIITGLQEVPVDAVDAANGMGLSPWRRLWSVELPLAVPAIMAGVRIATVSTISLVTVGALVGFGGLGNLVFQGLNSRFNAEVLTATVVIVVVALLADVAVLLLTKVLTPWSRGRTA